MFSVADLDFAEGVTNPKRGKPTNYFGSGKLISVPLDLRMVLSECDPEIFSVVSVDHLFHNLHLDL